MASTGIKRKLVICGGSGFLGSRICKAACSRGWDVFSISRSGEPIWSSVTDSASPPTWSTAVSWHKADILQPHTYKSVMEGADAVIHSMGILLEADYKGVLQGREPISKLFQTVFTSTTATSQSRLEDRAASVEHDAQNSKPKLTYELMNRDSALILAEQAAECKASNFVYISAAAGAPILPKRYITTKREAEAAIKSRFPDMRSIYVRPSFLYDHSRSITLPIAAMGGLASMVNSFVGGRLTGILGAGAIKPLKVDMVAEAVMEAIEDDNTQGPVDVSEIENLANRAWRRGML